MRSLGRFFARTLVPILAVGGLAGCATYQKCGFRGCPGDARITAEVQALRRHLMRARKCRGLGWERWSTQWLHANLGLFTGYRLRRELRKVISVA